MKTWFNFKTWLITLTMIVLAVAIAAVITTYEYSGGITGVSAGSQHNVSGWAWSENFGWVSFNCTNDNTCGTADYGVNIDTTTGNFSGYAWSSNIGWISFQENKAPNYGFNSNCPSSCVSSNNCTACYNSVDGKVYGWAKILSLGDDGWLKMSDDEVLVWNNKGVTIDSNGDFHGWAWNGNSTAGVGLGWLSFNCVDTSSCGTSDYKVQGELNHAPTAINLSAFNWNYAQASQYGALRALLRWEFSDPDPGSSQSAYQLIVSRHANFSSPIINTKFSGSASQHSLTSDNGLNYNTAYYWKIMVWDDKDAPSVWKNYDTTPDTDNNDGVPATFTTYKHEMPKVDFTWFPVTPSQGEEAQFSDSLKYYTAASPATPTNCSSGNCFYLWTVPGDATIDDAASANPKITFGSSGDAPVSLKVTDSDGYFSSLTKNLNLKQKLPGWKEVKPK